MKPFIAVLAALCGALCPADAPAETPNVVLIVADHMGASDIGAYGATDIATPSLDTLAAQGTRFTSYYAAAPICGPSRAAMLTGKYPARIGFEDNIGYGSRLSARLPTLPALLKGRGYENRALRQMASRSVRGNGPARAWFRRVSRLPPLVRQPLHAPQRQRRRVAHAQSQHRGAGRLPDGYPDRREHTVHAREPR